MPGIVRAAPPQAHLPGKSVFQRPKASTSNDAATSETDSSSDSGSDHTERDPHLLPDFTVDSVTQPTKPVLYLPPLLSSLPPSYAHVDGPSSEYPALKTTTHLPDIDPASLSLHKALHHFKPFPNYSATPYAEAFNWAELELPEDEEREWYIVAFRSRRKDGSDGSPLYEADRLAHEEAVANGGLLMYWYGVPDSVTGLNLATCIWQSRGHAVAANSRPHHIQAMRLAASSYEKYSLERHVLRKERGQRGLTIEEYIGGEVGW